MVSVVTDTGFVLQYEVAGASAATAASIQEMAGLYYMYAATSALGGPNSKYQSMPEKVVHLMYLKHLKLQ